MSTQFPLPRAPQQSYTKWFDKTITGGRFNKYTIVWVGSQLDCRFKSETIGEKIGPHNVFILKKNGVFAYAVIDNTETLYRLPKKYHTSCFPGIQYNSIPKNNEMRVRITKRQTIKLPFIPHSFLQQKKLKTNRSKRKRSNSTESNTIEQIDFNKSHPQWHVLTNEQVSHSSIKKELMLLIRSVLDHSCNNDSFDLKDPFGDISSVGDIQSNENRMKRLKLIVSFLYHYCRSELGCNSTSTMRASSLQSWLSDLNNTAIV